MDDLASVIEALSWPVATVIIVYLFKSEIGKLLPKVSKIKAGPIEAEFEREMEEVAAGSKDLLPSIEITQQVVSANDKLVTLAQIDARSAILEAWRNLESSLREAIIYRVGSTAQNISSSYKVVKTLEEFDILSSKEVLVVNDLRGLRNQAAQVDDFNPSLDSAFKYIELAKSLESSAKRAVMSEI